MQRAGQADVLVRVLGAIAEQAERLVYLAVGELDEVERVGDENGPGGGGGPVGGGQVHGQVAQLCGMAVEQAFSCFGGAALSQAEGPAGAEVNQVSEPLGAGLALAVCRAGDATAELVDPCRFNRVLMFVQVSELVSACAVNAAAAVRSETR